jgi:hypothetical protein
MGLSRQSLAVGTIGRRQARTKETAGHRKALAALEPQPGNYVSPPDHRLRPE